ncbi:ATP-binding protein [Embleya sp. NBC_00896]|uniref:ATP-binding protein n=1 Tax=Embleya sp. NBC_00896 TaxID=2975961 RepID=UPI0038662E00|nr:ATP-binding protein [Embleya sp. NBC_00896]
MTTLADPEVADAEDEVSPTITLPAMPACVSAVREHVRVALTVWDLDALSDIAVLLASELATNAVRHAGLGRPFSVVVRRDRTPDGTSCVWIEVHDTDPRTPEVVEATDDDTGGRGLLLVESLADGWESVPEPGGKCVRFRLAMTA